MTEGERENLMDERDAAVAMSAVASGAMETLSEAELDAYLAAASPMAFWREHRGMTQASLAALVQVCQAEMAQIETGRRVGNVQLYTRMAEALRVRMEDLILA